jgi:Fic family protein
MRPDAQRLHERARGEFLEMPGLRLTPAQASRLWAIDRATSEAVLDTLRSIGFLVRTGDGAYCRRSAP